MEKNPTFDLSFADSSRQEAWRRYAAEILTNLTTGNVGLVSDTGTGKTVMALLAAATYNRVLFVAPTTVLTRQHAALYQRLSGQKAKVMNGGIRKRDWANGYLTVATPHVFVSDLKKGLVLPDQFDLLIVDEMHHASGKYPYVELARLFQDKPILCLSASPGSNDDDIAWLEKIYRIKTWVKAVIDHYEIKSSLIKAVPNETLTAAGQSLKNLYFKALKELAELFYSYHEAPLIPLDAPNPFLKQAIYDSLEERVNGLSCPNFYDGRRLLAKLKRLNYLYRLLFTEGYEAFLDYVNLDLIKDLSRAAQEIINNNDFCHVFWTIKNIQQQEVHPKEAALLKILGENKSAIVFVGSQRTGRYLCALANSRGYHTGFIHGGQGRSIKEQKATIEAFSKKEISVIFATSVIEEGFDLPAVDLVINYNQPFTAIAKKQRSGRTGRFAPGEQIDIIIDDTYERSIYFAGNAQAKKMERLFYNKKSRKKSRQNDGRQLCLNFDFQN